MKKIVTESTLNYLNDLWHKGTRCREHLTPYEVKELAKLLIHDGVKGKDLYHFIDDLFEYKCEAEAWANNVFRAVGENPYDYYDRRLKKFGF